MPSNRHSYMVLAIFCVCALAICAFLSWRNQEKKDRLSRQYAEFSMPQTSKGSTPTQQKALLEILSREQKNISQTFPDRQQAAEPPPRSREKIFSPPAGHARVAGDESCRFRPVADPSGKGCADLQTPEGAGFPAGTENAPAEADGGHQAEGPGRQTGSGRH